MSNQDASALKFNNPRWVFAQVSKPILWPRCDQETWALTPPLRYVLTAELVQKYLSDYVESVSDLVNSAFYQPFIGFNQLTDSRILVERHRSRGVGDLLFMTGPMSFLHHLSGGKVNFYVKSLVDRGSVLSYHPAINLGAVLYGPTIYDTLPLYDYHWFSNIVTEFDESREQLNVYDALYRQIGFDYKTIEPKWKRPSVGWHPSDTEAFHAQARYVWSTRSIDLRNQPYYIVAPFSHGQLRTKSYAFWLDLIRELSKRSVVVVVGSVVSALTDHQDMSVAQFIHEINRLDSQPNSRVISMIGDRPLRILMMLIRHAKTVFCLDSAPLYIAQACGTPAISFWGTHDPRVRIGYDKAYMDLAVWRKEFCPSCPCFAYAQLPKDKCPDREAAQDCVVLQSSTIDDALEKLSSVEST